VTFSEHMSARDVAGMTSGIAAYGKVFSGLQIDSSCRNLSRCKGATSKGTTCQMGTVGVPT